MKPEERDAAYLWDMLEAARESSVLMEGVTADSLMSDLRTRRALERTLELTALERIVGDLEKGTGEKG